MPPSHTKPGFHTLYIFGSGGHGRELAWLAESLWPKNLEIRFLVDDERYLGPPVNGHSVHLVDDVVFGDEARYVIGLGDSAHRRSIAGRLSSVGAVATVLVHPSVHISSSVEIKSGSVVCAGSIVTVNATLGEHSHVNIGCTLSHDVAIGSFVTLSPGVHIAGNVRIESGAFLGIGASVINGRGSAPLVIGADAVVAAGACVTRDVPASSLVAGVPAVQKR